MSYDWQKLLGSYADNWPSFSIELERIKSARIAAVKKIQIIYQKHRLRHPTLPLRPHHAKSTAIADVLEEFLHGHKQIHYARHLPGLEKFFVDLKNQDWGKVFAYSHCLYYTLALYVDGEIHKFDLYNIIEVCQMLTSFNLTYGDIEFKPFFTPTGDYNFSDVSGKGLGNFFSIDGFLSEFGLEKQQFSQDYYFQGMPPLYTHGFFINIKKSIKRSRYALPSNNMYFCYSTYIKLLRVVDDIPVCIGPFTIDEIEKFCRDPKGYRRPVSVSFPSPSHITNPSHGKPSDIQSPHEEPITWIDMTGHDIEHRIFNNQNSSEQKALAFELMDFLRQLSYQAISDQAEPTGWTWKRWDLIDDVLFAKAENFFKKIFNDQANKIISQSVEVDLLYLYLLDPAHEKSWAVLFNNNRSFSWQEMLINNLFCLRLPPDSDSLLKNIRNENQSQYPTILSNLFRVRQWLSVNNFKPYCISASAVFVLKKYLIQHRHTNIITIKNLRLLKATPRLIQRGAFFRALNNCPAPCTAEECVRFKNGLILVIVPANYHYQLGDQFVLADYANFTLHT